MTPRFIVARILRELIELAECDDDAELVDALHDALELVCTRRRRAGSSTDPAASAPEAPELAPSDPIACTLKS